MTDTQSALPGREATMEERYIPFFTSINDVLREHQPLLQSLPEAMECLLQRCSPKINQTQHFEENSHEEMELERRQEVKDEMSRQKEEKPNGEMKINKTEKQLQELYQKKESKLKEVKEEILRREEEITRREKKIMGRQKQLEEALLKKDEELQRLRDEHSKILDEYKTSLSQAKQDSQAAHTRMKEYKLRLASLSEKNVKQDQTHVEDILGSNRQSELEANFVTFFDNERMDACEKMQAMYCNKEDDFAYIYYPRLACLIFETAYEQAKEVHEAAIHSFKEITKTMINYGAAIGQEVSTFRKLRMEEKYPYEHRVIFLNTPLWGKGSGYLKDVVDGMTLSLKEAAPTCNLDLLTQDVVNIAYIKWEKWCQDDVTCMFSPSRHLLSEVLVKYINACIKLTWKMVTQIPPMKLEYYSSKFDKEIHRNVSRVQGRTRLSTQKDQDKKIKCYLWPGLQDGRGRRIRHGEVLV